MRYDDFKNNPDINRLKVIFCDRYMGTSTDDYEYKSELERLKYLCNILDALSEEIGIEAEEDNKVEAEERNKVTNTYNSVSCLLKLKEKLRFFNLFTDENIKNKAPLRKVVFENFNFEEYAYPSHKSSMDSKNIWDISYFLEAQLYTDTDNFNILSKNALPNLKGKCKDKWYLLNRGEKNDSLYTVLQIMLNKEEGSNKHE